MARLSLAPAAGAERRREVERHLQARGWSGVARLPPPAGAALDAESARDLARALTGLGPVFAAFADYLSWRADLFDPAACLELAEAAATVEPAPPAAVAERLIEELGAGPAELFVGFEAIPISIGPLWQVHRATLPGSRPALVRLRRPGLELEIEHDLPHLCLLRSGWNGGRDDLAAAIADFGIALEAEIDASAMAEALNALARPASSWEGEPEETSWGTGRKLLTAPAVEARLSTSAVLTTSAVTGPRLATGHRFPGTASARSQADWGPGRYGPAYDLGPRLALAWLELAFAGDRFPLAADLVLAGDGRVAVEAGTFARLASAARGPLWEYLCATADHDPERAAEPLLRELEPGPEADAAELRKRLRQLVPLGDRRLTASRDGLARHLLANWQLARRCGFAARPALAHLYRGVFWLAEVTAPMTPAGEGDPLATALEDLRWQASFGEWRRLGMEPRTMMRAMESYATAFAALPRRLEAALDGLERNHREPAAGPARERRQNAVAASVTLAMLMAAVALLAGRLAVAMPAGRRWIETLATLSFLGLGALLLALAGGAARKRRDR